MTLNLGKKGHSYIIDSLHLPLQLQKRLEALGMTSGTSISVINSKSHGTLIISVRGTRFAVGRGISKNINVRD